MADETIDIEVKATTDMSDIESLEQAINDLNQSIIELAVAIDGTELEEAISQKEQLNEDTDFIADADSTGIDEAVSKKEQLAENVETKVEVDTSDLEALSAGLAGVGLADFGNQTLETAGAISDSWNRLELTFGSVNENLKKSISSTADETGRSGAITRNYFNMMGIAGIKNEKLISESMEAISGKAYQTGNDFNALGGQVQKMVLNGKIMKRALANMGLSMTDLANAMGTTEEEAGDMFGTLSQEQRLEVFTKAMGDGTKANEMYKNSFEGVKTKAKAEFDGLVGAIGTPLLSMIIPMLKSAKDAFSTFSNIFKSLPGPIQGGISSILGLGMAVGVFAGFVPIFTKAMTGVGAGFKTLYGVGLKIPGINKYIMSFGNVLKTQLGKSTLGKAIASLFKINLESKAVATEIKAIDVTAGGTTTTGGLHKQAGTIWTVNEGAMEVGVAGEAGYEAGAVEETGAGGLQAVASGLWAMVPAILQIAIVVAVIIAIIGALVAEVILIVKGIQLLIESMNFGSVDFSKTIKGLKSLNSAIWEIGKIMLAMTFTALLSGIYKMLTLGGLINPIETVKSDIKNTIKALNEIGTYGTVDKKVTSTLKQIGESVKAVGDVVGAMADTSWKVLMGNLMTLGGMLGDFQSLMNSAKSDMINAVQAINSMELSQIDTEKAEQLKKVSEALKAFGDAMSGLGDIQWTEFMNSINPFTDIAQSLRDAKGDLILASNALSEYDGLKAPPEGVGEKIKKVSDALGSVSEALSKISDIGWTEGMNWLNPLVDLSGNLASAKADIWFASQKLAELNDMPAIPTTVSEKLKTLGSTLATTVNTFKALETMDSTVFDLNFLRNISQSMLTAKNDIVNVSNIMKSLGEQIYAIPEGVGGQLQRVAWVANGVINAMNSLNKLSQLSIDPKGISYNIQDAFETIVDASEYFSTIGTQMYAIDGGVTDKLSTLTGIAKGIINTVTTLVSLPTVPEDISVKIEQAVNAVKTTIEKLNALGGSSVDGGISNVLTNVTTVLNNLKNTLASASGGFYSPSVNIGASIVNGIKQGMIPLTSTVINTINTSTGSGASNAWTGGARIGTSLHGGFQSALNLHTTMSTELSYTLQEINNAVQQYHSAGEQLGKSVVEGFQLGINTGSPGDVYHTMEDELNYVKYLIPSYNDIMKDASADLGTSVVEGFGNNSSLSAPQTTSQISNPIANTNSPTINIYVDGNINDENTMDKLVERLTKAITWSNAMGNRSV